MFSDDGLYGRAVVPIRYPQIAGGDWYLWNGIYKRSFLLKKYGTDFARCWYRSGGIVTESGVRDAMQSGSSGKNDSIRLSYPAVVITVDVILPTPFYVAPSIAGNYRERPKETNLFSEGALSSMIPALIGTKPAITGTLRKIFDRKFPTGYNSSKIVPKYVQSA